MEETSEDSLDLTFPRKYLRRLEEYRKRQDEILSEPNRFGKPPTAPKVFSDRCKQAIFLVNRVYCCALKELVEGSMCKGCPCYEREPLDYTLFRRV